MKKKLIAKIAALVVLIATVLSLFLESLDWQTTEIIRYGEPAYYYSYNPFGLGRSVVYGEELYNRFYFYGVDLIPGILTIMGSIYVLISKKKGDLFGFGIIALGILTFLILIWFSWSFEVGESVKSIVKNPYWSQGIAQGVEYNLHLGVGFFLVLGGATIGIMGALLERKFNKHNEN